MTPVAFSARRSRAVRVAPSSLREPLRQVTRIRAGLDLLACARENTSRRLDGERVVAHSGELVDRREVAQSHDQSLRSDYCASALRGSTGISAQFAS